LAISRGGVLKVAGSLPGGVTTIRIYATTFDGAGKEHRGPSVEVNIEH
jgi:hypothetical protein